MEPIEKDDHFIPDGMNAFERNVKRIGDCFLALGALIVFSPLFLIYLPFLTICWIFAEKSLYRNHFSKSFFFFKNPA